MKDQKKKNTAVARGMKVRNYESQRENERNFQL